MKKLITIMVPVYNEEQVIEEFYSRVNEVTKRTDEYNFEILFVNDGSIDKTLAIIKKLRNSDHRISYIDLSRNFGKEVAMLAGFDYSKGDAVVIIDADLQDPPELIYDMISYWEQGYDDVYAKRIDRQGETWLKKSTSKAFYRLLKKTTTIPIQQDTGDFRLLDRRCINALRQIRESQRYTKGLFSWLGFKKKEVLFSRDQRLAGNTKWNYTKLFNLAIEGITSFTTYPLKLSSYLGLLISIGAFIYMFVIIIKTLVLGESVSGYPSLMSVILFLGGIQLLSLGIIGEYLGRIFNETKKRPVYLVQEYNDNKDLVVHENE
ncbi:Glycosyltransferase involved in cell wall bisynthesis [Salinibacillus kushneri]|uniref:Glycosyltransferase involved in cell wall bisynthesis n=1 Tax=Salinibacillus kushneri TaxID=237682 RepID=A0A1I0JGQ9_9BACI|nr:glycosyltransferase family 2 protein [Salinibacillus kushneri]SEU09431.1 Glycosyltransferase involved in cell wall bisynthesis [Salinibacillus kushneri]